MAANKIAADAIVLADDVAEEVVGQAAEVVTVVKNNPILLAGVAVVSLAAGGFAGYKFAERKLTTKYDEALQAEIDATKKFYKTEEYSTPESVAQKLGAEPTEVQVDEELDELDKKLVRQIRAYHQTPTRQEQLYKVSENTVVKRNVFDAPPVVNLDEDDMGGTEPSETEPYLISFNEYHSQTDPGWTQLALTYYSQDDTLAGEDDQIIDSVEATIGVNNLDIIRHSEKETTFVRNPRTEMEFEVARYDRSYARTVLGLGDGG